MGFWGYSLSQLHGGLPQHGVRILGRGSACGGGWGEGRASEAGAGRKEERREKMQFLGAMDFGDGGGWKDFKEILLAFEPSNFPFACSLRGLRIHTCLSFQGFCSRCICICLFGSDPMLGLPLGPPTLLWIPQDFLGNLISPGTSVGKSLFSLWSTTIFVWLRAGFHVGQRTTGKQGRHF